MEEENKGVCVKWEDDQEDETKETSVVKAPNGKFYRIRAISAIEQARIADATQKIMSHRRPGRGRDIEMDFNMDSVRNQILILQKGVVEPDFSKRSEAEIEVWMSKKSATVSFLVEEIGKKSGFRGLLQEQEV